MSAVAALLVKDLRLLARSRALVAILVLYPLLLALLVAAVTRDAGSLPRVALVEGEPLPAVLHVGTATVDVNALLAGVERRAEVVRMPAQEAKQALANGDVVAVVTVPEGFASAIQSTLKSPTLTVETRDDPLGQRARNEVRSLVYSINRDVQRELLRENVSYLKVLVQGGSADFMGRRVDILGLKRSSAIVDAIRARSTSPRDRAELARIAGFARDASLALGFADGALTATARPVSLQELKAGGAAGLFANRATALVVAIGLTLVGIVLGAAALAVEREERTLVRLLRGPIGAGGLVLSKLLVVALASAVLGVLLAAAALAASVLAGGGAPGAARLIPVAAAALVGGAALGAVGVLIGALVRELSAAALVAVLVALPFVLVGLVPNGLAEPLGTLSRAFPFAPLADALAAALYDPSPWSAMAGSIAALAAIAAVAGALAWPALSRSVR